MNLYRAALLAALALAVPAAIVYAESPAPPPAPHMLPAPVTDVAPAGPGLQTAVFAGGCFWGIQGVFEHVKGVTQAVSGYAGGTVADPSYEQVSSGRTGHAESVRVTFDPSQVTYGTLLQIFFTVGLDPTEVDRQGPDWGTQYRSALFVNGPEQEQTARAYLAQLTAAHVYDRPIATRIDPAGAFYPAEGYHQDYLVLHPNAPYIAYNDMPKVRDLESSFPAYWKAKATTVNQMREGS